VVRTESLTVFKLIEKVGMNM